MNAQNKITHKITRILNHWKVKKETFILFLLLYALTMCLSFGLAYSLPEFPLPWLTATALCLVQIFYSSCVLPIATKIKLGHERFKLNLNAQKIPLGEKTFQFVLGTRLLFFVTLFASILFNGFKSVSLVFPALGNPLAGIFETTQISAKLEFPAFQEKSSVRLNFDSTHIEPANTQSILTVSVVSNNAIANLGSKKLALYWVATAKNKGQKEQTTTTQTKLSNVVCARGEFLFTGEKTSASGNLATLIPQECFASEDEVQLYLSRTNFSENIIPKETARVLVAKIPNPEVQLSLGSEPAQANANSSETNSKQNIAFLNVNAKSEIPLSSVVLEINSSGGFRTQKQVGEFLNTQEKDFSIEGTKLDFNDFPIKNGETIQVVAVAKTVLPNVLGRSQPLVFEFVSTEKQIQNMLEKLNAVVEELKQEKISEDSSFLEKQSKIDSNLNELTELSKSLGRAHPAHKRLQDSKREYSASQSWQDSAQKKTIEKLMQAKKSLEKQKETEQTQSFFQKLDSLARNFEKFDENARQTQVAELCKDSKDLKQKLKESIEKKNNGLTPEEQSEANNLLDKDSTPELVCNTKQFADAAKATQSAQQNLGGMLRLLSKARARAVEEAKQKLAEIDEKLENSKQMPNKKQATEKLQESQKAAQKLPELGNEFDKIAKQLQEKIEDAKEDSEKGKEQGQKENTEKAQEKVVEAIEALQEEQESQRQNQANQDKKQSESDVLAKQEEQDGTWRQKLQLEISRLRAESDLDNANTSDSVIPYLEGLLK